MTPTAWWGRSESGTFASRSLLAHLLRGGAAFAALAAAFEQQHDRPVLAMALGIAALALFRGCPMCWTIGLVETAWQRLASSRTFASRSPPSLRQLE